MQQSDIERIKAGIRRRLERGKFAIELTDDQARALLAELERLEGVVAKLNVTKDGVPVVTGKDHVYHPDHPGLGFVVVGEVALRTIDRMIRSRPVAACYSTEAAALAASPAHPAPEAEEGGDA